LAELKEKQKEMKKKESESGNQCQALSEFWQIEKEIRELKQLIKKKNIGLSLRIGAAVNKGYFSLLGRDTVQFIFSDASRRASISQDVCEGVWI
jgi:hypothetical protein